MDSSKATIAANDIAVELEEYELSLQDLRSNDKIRINFLSMLADDHKNSPMLPHIVKLIERNIREVSPELKLCRMYLVDSILKNVGGKYIEAFAVNLVFTFSHVFESTGEKTRAKLFPLRRTWDPIFPNSKLYALDMRIKAMDPAWPVTSKPPPTVVETTAVVTTNTSSLSSTTSATNAVAFLTGLLPKPTPPPRKIHVNPNFIRKGLMPETTVSGSAITRDEGLGSSGSIKDVIALDCDTDTVSGSSTANISLPVNIKIKDANLRDPRIRKMLKVDTPDMTTATTLSSMIGLENASALTHRAANDRILGDVISMEADEEPVSLLIDRRGDEAVEKHARIQGIIASEKEMKSIKLEVERQEEIKLIESSASTSAAFAPVQFAIPPPPPPPPPRSSKPHDHGRNSEDKDYTELFGHCDRDMRNVDTTSSVLPTILLPGTPSITPGTMDNMRGFVPPAPPPKTAAAPIISGLLIADSKWKVTVPGMDDMPDIGFDPRLLCPSRKLPGSRIHQDIHINSNHFTLLLDRLQPLVMIQDQYHGVRFKSNNGIKLWINKVEYILPSNGFILVDIFGKPRVACMGGPFHELILDGQAFHVPFTGQLIHIPINFWQVEVKFASYRCRGVDILPPIPPYILDWSWHGFFGPAIRLDLAPSNPRFEITRYQEMMRQQQRDLEAQQLQEQQRLQQSVSNIESSATRFVPPAATLPSTSIQPLDDNVNVAELINKLLDHGLLIRQVEVPLTPEVISVPEITVLPSTLSSSMSSNSIPGLEITTADIPGGVPLMSINEFKLAKFDEKIFSKQTTVIADLYSGFVCAQCGQRFESFSSKESTEHQDYHVRQNSNISSQTRKARGFGEHVSVWLIGQNTFVKENTNSTDVNNGSGNTDVGHRQCSESMAVEGMVIDDYAGRGKVPRCLAFKDESLNVCSVCFDKFDDEWDDELDAWVLVDAVKRDDLVYHTVCVNDIGKSMRTKTLVT